MTTVPNHRIAKDSSKIANLMFTLMILNGRQSELNDQGKLITNIVSNLLSTFELRPTASSLQTKFVAAYRNPSLTQSINAGVEGAKLIMCAADVARALKEAARAKGYQLSPYYFNKVDTVSSSLLILYSVKKAYDAAVKLRMVLSPPEYVRESVELYKHTLGIVQGSFFLHKTLAEKPFSPKVFSIVDTALQPAKTLTLYEKTNLLLWLFQTKIKQG